MVSLNDWLEELIDNNINDYDLIYKNLPTLISYFDKGYSPFEAIDMLKSEILDENVW